MAAGGCGLTRHSTACLHSETGAMCRPGAANNVKRRPQEVVGGAFGTAAYERCQPIPGSGRPA
ncbi:hypothetical protein XMIN_3239 [Xanthomonas citri pv. mangiferaeindicae LMG 941]|nr:hypothetical protein XMIN_3239 [Xanthomonas citri pv. mangiferaeindicae LMG 941]